MVCLRREYRLSLHSIYAAQSANLSYLYYKKISEIFRKNSYQYQNGSHKWCLRKYIENKQARGKQWKVNVLFEVKKHSRNGAGLLWHIAVIGV